MLQGHVKIFNGMVVWIKVSHKMLPYDFSYIVEI